MTSAHIIFVARTWNGPVKVEEGLIAAIYNSYVGSLLSSLTHIILVARTWKGPVKVEEELIAALYNFYVRSLPQFLDINSFHSCSQDLEGTSHSRRRARSLQQYIIFMSDHYLS